MTDVKSPFNLIQEEYKGKPWHIAVCSIVYNNSKTILVRPVLENFFSKFSNEHDVLKTPKEIIENILQPCGIHKRKTYNLLLLCRRFALQNWETVEDLPGLGVIGREYFRVFALREIIEPTDKTLKAYVDWLKEVNKNQNS